MVRACDSRVRRRLIYTSRDSQVRVTMPLTAAATRPPRATVGYYLLHFQGTHVRRSFCIAPATERPRAHHNTVCIPVSVGKERECFQLAPKSSFSSVESLFHVRGAAKEKALSPIRRRDHGTTSLLDDEARNADRAVFML